MKDRGVALVIALLAMSLFTALGLTLVLNTAIEVMIAGNFEQGQEAFYAADAGLERVMDELGNVADWNPVLSGAERSTFVDGSPSGTRTLAGASIIDLTKATNMLNCGRATSCTSSEMDASTADRPWGVNNPRWSLYAYGPLSGVVWTSTINSTMYIAVWVGDDQSENDDNPETDGNGPDDPGSGILMIHSEAFGPGGTHRVLEATIGRIDRAEAAQGIRAISWREIR